jgi:hypothetical protein
MAHATLPGMFDPRRSTTLWILALGVGSGLNTDAGERHEAAAAVCSFRRPGMIRLRDPGSVAFVGTATDDTVHAGPGSVQYGTEGGHFGPGTPRSIYGQGVRVDRAEQAAPPAFRDAIAAGNRSVVLVPWDYGPDCGRVPWNRSARWLPFGTKGAFVARLRDRGHWAGDRPTFDVIPEITLYPPTFAHQRRPRHQEAEVSPEEFLTLYELLPDRETLYAEPEGATAPLTRWAQANPDRAAKLPVVPLLSFMRWEARIHQYRNKPSPIAGTYRVVYRAASGDSSVFYARTERHPTSLHISHRVTRADTAALDDRRPIGHSLLVEVAPSLSELPRQRRSATNPLTIQGYFEVIDSVATTSSGTVILPGSIDLHAQAIRLATDRAARTALQASGQPATGGRFTVNADGQVRFQLVVERDGSPILTVRADRISTQPLLVLRPPE